MAKQIEYDVVYKILRNTYSIYESIYRRIGLEYGEKFYKEYKALANSTDISRCNYGGLIKFCNDLLYYCGKHMDNDQRSRIIKHIKKLSKLMVENLTWIADGNPFLENN